MREDFRLAIRGHPAYSRGEPVLLTFELANVGDTEYRLLIWNTPLEGEVLNFLEVRHAGHVVPYDGRFFSRGDPGPASYRTIRAGEAIAEQLDIAESYALDEPGEYEVTLLVRFADVIPVTGPEAPTARPRQEHQGLVLGPVTTRFELLPDGPARPTAGERARTERPKEGARLLTIGPGAGRPAAEERDIPVPPEFAEVDAADANARAWLDAAIAELASWTAGTDNTLYTEWFGEHDAARYKTVLDRFAGTRAWMNTRIHYDLSPSDCRANSNAYTHLGSDTVYICPNFFRLPVTGTDARFGTIVHEWSHASPIVDTDDIVYGLPASRDLAVRNPDAAAKNADNYSSFVETLSLRMLTAPVFLPNGQVYFFAGGQYYRMDPGTRQVDPDFPRPIAPHWPGLWSDRIDAGVMWNNGKAYFFRDGQYMRYDVDSGKVDPGYPLSISAHWRGLWGDRIDAAVLWDNGKAYFFRDDQYMQYDVDSDQVDPGYPKPIAGNWPGLWGNGVQGAVMWNDGRAYLLRGWQYVGYDVATQRAAPAYPRAIGENWPGLWSDGGIDVALMYSRNDAVYFMRGTEYRAYDIAQDRVVHPDFPLTIEGNWPGLWGDGIDAAVPWPGGKVYFFRGSEFMRWDVAANRVDPGFPLPMADHWPGLWGDGLDAAVLWPNGKAYFLRGSEYMRYDVAAGRVDPGYPLPIDPFWPGLWGDGVDAGVVWDNGTAYFFKGSEYMRYDITADRVEDGYPLPIGSNWPGLPGRTG
ncbi:hemopexin repeat-containing protein [Streptomyces kutzneri]|uniref:hemopexin repeat-containing protein n=1 Tax=Streptomyces kutzneri TaxID=3051179 RepID=UPI0028D87B8A|nr:hemopexin repeat-containing protein [Streptomyces sp. DSM 40907]